MCIATELVTMKPSQGITKGEFITIVDGLERNFHSKQSGFINTELLYDEENNLWVMIQHWESLELLKAASNKMFVDSAAEPFVKALNPESVKITIAPQVKTWG